MKAVADEAVAHSFLDVVLKEFKIVAGASAHFQGPVKGKIVQLSRWTDDSFVWRVALALNNQNGGICSGKGAEVIEPVGKWAVTKRE